MHPFITAAADEYKSSSFQSGSMKQSYINEFCESAPSMEGSPGSKVHSSRGALLEMPLRFLRTLLMMLPTPPEPCWRSRPPVLGLLPPPAPAWSLSCLISREGNRPLGQLIAWF